MDLILVRLLFVVVVSITCYVIAPFGRAPNVDAGIGAVVGLGIVLFEWKLRAVSLKRLIGAAIGSILGICGAYLFALVIRSSVPSGNTQSFLQILVMLLMAYVGLAVGANKGDLLNLAALGGIFGGEKQGRKAIRSSIPASSSTAASPTSPKPGSSTASLLRRNSYYGNCNSLPIPPTR